MPKDKGYPPTKGSNVTKAGGKGSRKGGGKKK